MSGKVFHFSTSEYLPWILKSRKLVPVRDHIRGLGTPPSNFLWASTLACGDPVSPAVISRKLESDHEWECDFVHLVRFTLSTSDFAPWRSIIKQFPEWKPEHIKLMEDHARSWDGCPSTWRCRLEPLPAEKWLAVETRSYHGQWQPVDYRDWDFVNEYWRMPLTACDAHRLVAQSKRRIIYSKRMKNNDV